MSLFFKNKISYTTRGDAIILDDNGSGENIQCFSANHVACTPTQYVDLPIIYTLGSEEYEGTLNTSIGYVSTDLTGGDWNLKGEGTGTYLHPFTTGIGTGTEIVVSFNAKINSGSLVFTGYYNGSETITIPPYHVVDGYNELIMTDRVGATVLTIYTADANNRTCDIDFTNISIKKITIPTNSYVTRYDVATKQFIQVANEHDRESSTAEFAHNPYFTDNTNDWEGNNKDSSFIWNNGKAEFDMTADWAYQRQNPAFTLIGDFSMKAKIDAINGSLHIGLGQYGNTITSVGASTQVVRGLNGATELQIRPIVAGLMAATIDYMSVKEILPIASTYKMTTAFSQYFTHSKALTQADLDALNANPNLIIDVWLNGVSLPSGFNKSDMVDYFGANEGKLDKLYNAKDGSVATIQAYTDTVRDTYKNVSFGVQDLIIEKDSSGRMLRTVPPTTGDGKRLVFPIVPPYDYTGAMCMMSAIGDTNGLVITHCDGSIEEIGTPPIIVPPTDKVGAFAIKMKSVAQKQIDKFGNNITIQHIIRGATDPATGDVNEIVVAVHTKGVVEEFDSSLIVAGVVNMDDLKIMCYADPVPKVGDKVIMKGDSLNIISVRNITMTQNGVIIYSLQVRR